MKPLSSRPPPHTTQTRRRPAGTVEGGGGGGGGGGSGGGNNVRDSGVRVDVSVGSGRGGVRTSEVIIDRSSFPQWMKTLEDRWQKLHSKINCPASHGSGARFNWVARRLLGSQRLARTAKNSTNNNNTNGSNRCNSTAPNTTTYKQGLGEGDGEDEDDDIEYDVNDNVFGCSNRHRPVTSLNTVDGELLSVSAAGFNNYLGSRPDSVESYRLGFNTPRRSMRDGAVEGNKNSQQALAPDLVHTDSTSRRNSAVRTHTSLRSASAVLDKGVHRGGSADVGGDNGGGGDVGDEGAGGGGEGNRAIENGVRSGAWADPGSKMNGTSARGVRTLNSLGSTGGHMLRTAKTGVSQVSHITTKSCPAALNVHDMASWGRGAGSGDRGGTGGGRRRQGMKTFPQMSMEARHAIETLRETGAGDKDGDNEDNEDCDHDNDDVNSEESEVSLPSLPTQLRLNDSDYSTQPGHSMVSKGDTTSNNRRGARLGDTASSVNATVRRGRSPRNKNTKRHISHANTRVRPKTSKSFKTDVFADDDARTNAAQQGEELDLFSMASVGSASSEPKQPVPDNRCANARRTRLPAITSRTEPHVLPLRAENMRHVNYRIQGVGSYKVPREATFEITAPDFDIRYRDVITCQRGDRETPPPDIFNRSVNKVKDWLNKYYTPR